MLKYFKLPEDNKQRNKSLIFLSIGIVLLIVTFIIGFQEKIISFSILVAAVISLMLVYIHTWKKVSRFQLLLVFSIIGLFFFIMLYNLFAGMAEVSTNLNVVQIVLESLSLISFYVSIIICPAGIIIGFIGMAIKTVQKKISY